MAEFTADISAWTEKAKRNIDLVVKGSIQDVGELMTRRQASVKETGSFSVGRVPVDTGQLIGSVVVEINGSFIASGSVAGDASQPPDFSASLIGMEMGDTVTIAFTAPYARHVEYGTSNFAGRFFVRNAVQEWETIVMQNAAQFAD